MKIGFSLNTNAGEYGDAIATPGENRDFLYSLLAQGEEADRLGYDGVFVAERHSRPECRIPTTLQLLSMLALKTTRCDLVSHVLLLPLHHPCDVAEQAAVVDIASGGRLTLGVGMGFDERYFRTFDVRLDERRTRFEESLEIMELAWLGEPFDYKGTHYSIHDGRVLPRSFRSPRPTVWIGGEVPASVTRAARFGDAWVVAWPVEQIKWDRLTNDYRAKCAEYSKIPQIAYSQHCWFADSRADAEKWFVPKWLEEMSYYWKKGRLKHPDFASESDFTVETARKHMIYGDADDCLEALAATRKRGVGYVKLSMRLPLGPSIGAVSESMRGFATEVLPRLAEIEI